MDRTATRLTESKAGELGGPVQWGVSAVGRGDFVLPVGTVTLLLLDVEGSTRMWESRPEAATEAIVGLYEVIADAIGRHGGVQPVEQGEGDSAVAAFARASDAVACALEIQRTPDMELQLRMGLHTGEVQLRDEGNYIGATVNRCARIRDLGHGGQVLLSRATHDLVVDRLPAGASLLELGTHRLRDLARPELIFQLCHPELESDFPALRSLDTTPNNLPVQLTSFIGREDELDQVAKLLGDTRLLTVTGAGGCGKTRLALHAAADAIDAFPDGAWFVDFAPIVDSALVPSAVAAVLGIKEAPGRDWIDTIARRLAEQRALLLLDNCEHVVAASAELADGLLRACGAVVVLATSREPLGVGGEVTWRVPNLTVPDEHEVVELEAMASSDAVCLFIDRATRARPNFAVTNETAPAVAQICQRLDGIPLAIELAAARVRVLSPQQIAAGLDDRFRMLGAGARTAVPRHQTLRASIDSSYDLLTEPERLLFRRLGVFAGGFDLDAAEDVCSDSELDRWRILEVLVALVDRSLVVADEEGDTVRYKMLETIRQYAVECLVTSGEQEVLRDRHLEHYEAFALRTEPELWNNQATAIESLNRELDNLRAAIEWSTQGSLPERGARLCGALPAYWYMTGAYTEGARRSAGLATADMSDGAKAAVLVAGSNMQMYCGDIEGSIETAAQALELARAANDRRMEARALWQICLLQLMVDPIESRAPFEEAIAMLRETQDWWVLNDMLGAFGLVLALCGDFVAARPLLDEAMNEAQRAGDADHVASYVVFEAFVAEMQGRFEETERLGSQGAECSRQTGNAMWTAAGLVCQAAGHVGLGRYADTRRVLDDASAVGSEDGLTAPLGKLFLGAAALGEGDPASALGALTEALDEWSGISLWLSRIYSLRAEACLGLGDLPTARAAIDEALVAARRIESGYDEGRALAVLGRVERFEGNIERAESLVHDALRLHAANSDRPALAQTLESLGGIAASLESRAEAARLFGAAQALRDEMGFVRYAVHQQLYDADVATTRDGLGVEGFDAAWAEGAAMPVDDVVAYAQRGRGERKRPSSGWASLTPTELEVVKLVAEGLTNPQIAERMFVALGTVRTHVGHIFAKLGVSTRAELASLATKRQEA